MNLESIKSFTLTFLVGLSLLLTFGLWSFQPNDDTYRDQKFQSSVDIGGQDDIRKQDLIEPSIIMFHTNGLHYGFADPANQQTLYESMQLWSLSDFQVTQETEKPTDNKQVEIAFPAALPMEILSSLLTFNELKPEVLPDWMFNRIVITFNHENSALKMHFISENGSQQATALVNNSSKYNLLWAYITEKNDLHEMVAFDKGTQPIYIPLNEVSMLKRQFTVIHVEPNKLVDALFPETTLVSKTGNYYNDGTLSMRILNNDRSIRFFNPAHSDPNYLQMNVQDLLDFSIKNINDHKGWTDNYRLVKIDPQTNMIRYRMYYEGYPAFSTDLSTIEQQWREDENLYEYRRPLISIKSDLSREQVTLRSGADLISYLERKFSSTQDLGRIQDIKVGYQYTYNDDSSFSITLDPAWFMKLDDEWQLIDFEPKKGGVVDAMESN